MRMESDSAVIYEGERLDQIGFGNLRLLQKPEEFCYGIDAVLLADFAASRGWQKTDEGGYRGLVTACDLGTGTGIIPLILSHKLSDSLIIGVEVQQGSYERACRNVILNELQTRLLMMQGDVNCRELPFRVREAAGEFYRKSIGGIYPENSSDKGINLDGMPSGFDLVTVNPPYTESGRGLDGKNQAKMIARQETTGTLEDFIRTAALLLKEKGDFYLVHRPSRLVDICCLCRKYRIEPKALRFVSSKLTEAPNIMLLHGVLSGGRGLRMQSPLAVYDGDGQYTQEINMIYER